MKKLLKNCCGVLLSLQLSFLMITGVLAVHPSSRVLVGGMPFGVKFTSEGIVVVGFTEIETASGVESPAYDAGIRQGDVITHVCGQPVKTCGEMLRLIENTPDEVEITFLRNGEENTVCLTPSLCREDGKMKTGMWIRDTTAGIGTVTCMDPESGMFTGLGHGICDAESGKLLAMDKGNVVDVEISGVTKGIAGTPGELRGYFTGDKTGVLFGNTDCGVYGIFTTIPEEAKLEEQLEVANRWEVNAGDARIRCTLEDGIVREYTVELSDIRRESMDNRSFTVKVTDEELLSRTGGIIQGMSGSPILQNGKLIGAVTHVCVNL